MTQTFVERKLSREIDIEFAKLSEMVVKDLTSYLREEIPNAIVGIDNDWNTETVATSYARLTIAKKIVICGCSTFCPYPVMRIQDDVLAYLYNLEYLNVFYPKYLAET